MRLGLMGGTFDPIHRGHLQVARAALGLGLERVDFVPARRPPHKRQGAVAGPFDRFAMAALATVNEPSLRVCDFELARDAASYTIETVRHFDDQGHEVTLIMGSDSLADLENWRACRELVERARVLAYPRRPAVGEALVAQLPDWIRERLGPVGARIALIEEAPDDVSSSEIRDRLQAGREITGLTPPAVEEYIHKHHVYGGSPPAKGRHSH